VAVWLCGAFAKRSSLQASLRRTVEFQRRAGLRQNIFPNPFGRDAERLDTYPLSLATAEDRPQYLSQPESGFATQSTYDIANPDQPAYCAPVARIAP
jgi:hypothetical protein